MLYSIIFEQMKYAAQSPELSDISLATVMQALADPCRQQIVLTLLKAEGRPLACNEFELSVSKATASHHFDTLRKAGVICSCTEGTKCMSSLRNEELETRFPGLLKLLKTEAATQ